MLTRSFMLLRFVFILSKVREQPERSTTCPAPTLRRGHVAKLCRFAVGRLENKVTICDG